MLFRVKEGVNVAISCRRRSHRIIHSQLRILDDSKAPAMVNVRSSVNQVMKSSAYQPGPAGCLVVYFDPVSEDAGSL